MKKLLIVFMLLLSSISFAANSNSCILDRYEKIEMKVLPEYEHDRNYDTGVLHANTPQKGFGIYGVDQCRADLLARVIISSKSWGIMSNLIAITNDKSIEVKRIEGLKLKSICSSYNGLNAGAAFLTFGQDYFSVSNSNGVELKSDMNVNGILKLNLSYKRIVVKCLNQENPNWEKIIRL